MKCVRHAVKRACCLCTFAPLALMGAYWHIIQLHFVHRLLYNTAEIWSQTYLKVMFNFCDALCTAIRLHWHLEAMEKWRESQKSSSKLV